MYAKCLHGKQHCKVVKAALPAKRPGSVSVLHVVVLRAGMSSTDMTLHHILTTIAETGGKNALKGQQQKVAVFYPIGP